MAASKGTKRIAEAALDVNNWNTLERLILSQALYEFGVDNLASVAELMTEHPMLSRPKSFFTVKSCSAIYEKLMEDASLTCPEPTGSRHNLQLKQLATIHYQKRTWELKEDIDAEETKFKNIVREIDEIRAGLWDDRIRQSLGAEPVGSTTEEHPIPAEDEPIITEPEVGPPDDGDAAPTASEGVDTQTETQVEPQTPENASAVQPSEPMLAETSVDQPEVSEGVLKSVPLEEEEEDVIQEVVIVADEGEAMDIDVSDASAQPQEADEPEPESEPPAAPPTEDLTEEQEKPLATQEEPPVAAQDVDAAVSPESESLRDAKRKASESPSDVARERKRLREGSEVMEEEEPGPSVGRGRKKTLGAPDKKFQNVINMLHGSISQHRYGNIFHNPIKKQDASDYHDIVKRPMDLKTIKQRVKEGTISNSLEFQRDVYLMFANAMIYNRPGSDVHAMAEEMMLESEIQINAFRQTEGFHRS